MKLGPCVECGWRLYVTPSNILQCEKCSTLYEDVRIKETLDNLSELYNKISNECSNMAESPSLEELTRRLHRYMNAIFVVMQSLGYKVDFSRLFPNKDKIKEK